MLYFKGRLEMILSILNILLIIGNSYMVFIHTPQLVEEEFTKNGDSVVLYMILY